MRTLDSKFGLLPAISPISDKLWLTNLATLTKARMTKIQGSLRRIDSFVHK